MAGYIGSVPVPQATETRDVYTATSNQTSFTTGGYTPNFVSVYLNGVHLAQADYTATNGSDVVLASGATADDTVEIVSFGTFQVADVLPISGGTMTGDLIIPDGDLVLGSTPVTATAAEINLIKGATARGTTAVADGDGVLVNDAGTMRMTNVTTLATYMGTKITGGSMVFIASSGAISDDATADFIQFDANAYDSYEFHFIDVLPATDDVEMRALTSSDTSNHSYDTGSADYTVALAATTTAAYGQLFKAYGIGSAANEGFNAKVSVLNPHTSNYTKIAADGGTAFLAAGAEYNVSSYNHNGFVRKEAAQVNAIRFYFESGNIASGEIVMYGIANGT